MQFDKLIKLIDRLDKEDKDCFRMTLASFFGECLSPDLFPFGIPDLDLGELREKVGDSVFQSLYMCAVEFFLSNEYPDNSDSWNAIDFLLKKRGALFSLQDKLYLKGLRDSYMSLYEVIDVKMDQSLTLRNLLEEKSPPLIVKEKRGTHYICQWDVLGARIVKASPNNLLAGGLLILSREGATAAKEVIHRIEKVMMKKENILRFQKETKDPILMIKKMRVKEIAENWLMEKMERAKEPTYLNYDGDKLKFYTIEYPLKGTIAAVVNVINKLPELTPHDIEGVVHAWIWPLKADKKKLRQPKPSQGKEVFLDTQLSDHEGRVYRLFAELKINGKKLIIDVNSEQRANIVEDFFQTHLASLIGDPARLKHDFTKASETQHSDSEERASGLSLEEEESFTRQLFDRHYREWLDSPLPPLKGKTPRQAVKTKHGLQNVIELLKDMVNTDLRAVQQGDRKTSYDFSWLFSELGIEKHLL